MTVSMPEGSVEYVNAEVKADTILDTQFVDIAVTTGRPGPDTTWLPAEWTGTPGTTRTARVLYEATTRGLFTVYVRVTDDPEVPLIRAGSLRIA